ncbi:hypothetical protein [Thermoflavimicrobium daqui]|nr:hypothetical protein [Thermoflavimicrobium daqui]
MSKRESAGIVIALIVVGGLLLFLGLWFDILLNVMVLGKFIYEVRYLTYPKLQLKFINTPVIIIIGVILVLLGFQLVMHYNTPSLLWSHGVLEYIKVSWVGFVSTKGIVYSIVTGIHLVIVGVLIDKYSTRKKGKSNLN